MAERMVHVHVDIRTTLFENRVPFREQEVHKLHTHTHTHTYPHTIF